MSNLPKSKTSAKPAARKKRPTTKPVTQAGLDRQLKKLVVDAARLIADLHGENVLVLDIHELSSLADYLIIATGTSETQMQSVAKSIDELAHQRGFKAMNRDYRSAKAWAIVDLGDVVVHLFDQASRDHYDLEMMWGDAPKVRWQRTAKTKKAKPAAE